MQPEALSFLKSLWQVLRSGHGLVMVVAFAFVCLGLAQDYNGVTEYSIPGSRPGSPSEVGSPMMLYVMGTSIIVFSFISACLFAAEAQKEKRKAARSKVRK